jgi:hypothetical protein
MPTLLGRYKVRISMPGEQTIGSPILPTSFADVLLLGHLIY